MNGQSPVNAPADALVLTFTQGVSLTQWQESGVLDREWALYRSLSGVYSLIVLVTWGDQRDEQVLESLRNSRGTRLALVANSHKTPDNEYPTVAATEVVNTLKGLKSALIKTNQHADGGMSGELAAGCRRAGVRTGLIARGGYPISRFSAWQNGPHSREALDAGRREGELCRGADVVVGTTREMLDDLAWRHGLKPERLKLIPNYVLEKDVSSNSGGPRSPREVLSAGRLVAQKRFDVLIGAAARLGADAVHVTIAGDGPERAVLESQARELHAPVRFVGRLDHAALLDRMAHCAVYCQTSAYEGHPKTVLEAMSAGAPAVVVDSPGLREVVGHGETGIVSPLEIGAVSRAIGSLLTDRAAAARLGEAGRAKIRESCSLERVVALELEAHHAAMATAGEGAARPSVSFDPGLIAASCPDASNAWATTLEVFAKRRGPASGAAFLLALDQRLYDMTGRFAIDAEQTAGTEKIHPKHRLMRYHDFFAERIGPTDRVIDLGCGVGAVARSIARRTGAHVTGMDWSESNLAKAARLETEGAGAENAGKCQWVRGDITCDRAAGKFDVVVLSNVLEHLKDRPQLLRKYREWYGAGRFLIRVPAFDRDWRVPLKQELGLEWRLDETHEIEFTELSLRQELGEAGFRIAELISRWGEYWCEARCA